ncbi:ankyrin repeat-containing domain protein [Flagelloscypha sp. PMI_526]|nr:ankyrin repeat-containing domain protein [Flagelloscypha sp. PMI_526]
MAESGRASGLEHEPITTLTLDGSPIPLNALSELYILQEAAGRWAFNKGLSVRGEDVRPMDLFNIIGGTGIGGFYAVLFVSLKMTIGQVIRSHGILERRLFRSDAWNNRIKQACVGNLNTALAEIVKVLDIKTPLDSPFEEQNPVAKCFVCLVNPAATKSCRLFRNYRPRAEQGPSCTIGQVLFATLANHVHLSPVRIGEEWFLSALNSHPNPTHVLVKELRNAFVKGTHVACLVNVGAGNLSVQPLEKQKDAEIIAGLLQSCQLVADDVATQCHDLGSFFFRFSVTSELEQEPCSLEDKISQIIGLTMAYLSTNEVSTRLDDMEETLHERFAAVSIERLSNVAGRDGESRVAARLAKVEEHLNDTIFRDVNNWLEPIRQTSKLDANIRARSGTTCRWLLENIVFLQWMEKPGLFWLRGLMGTGKTVLSSFVVETLLSRDDIYVAYYYFEFTNPITLSEEALLRSLLCQLACASPAVVRALYQKQSKGSLQPQLATLKDTLNGLVEASAKPVFIIIDALDELPVAQRKYLLQTLVNFSRAHVIVTSREEVDIHQAFKKKVDFELGVQGDLLRQDIAAFVDRELQSEKWTFWSQDAIEMARRVLNERADGQFRMVACQVDILQQVKTYEQLQRALHSLPKTLCETYYYILEKIPANLRHQAHRLFTILSFALRPISVPELSALIVVEFNDQEDPTQLPKFRGENRFVNPLDVMDLGASLVSRVNRFGETALQLAHASVKEHFLAHNTAWFSLREDLAHVMIARSCIALLVHHQALRRGDEEHEVKVKSNYYAISYSKSTWFDHVLPDGPPQLLREQEHLYTLFPSPYILDTDEDEDEFQDKPPKPSSSLASAAFLGLVDLVKTLLSGCLWGGADLASALTATITSKRDEPVRKQCFHVILASGVDVNFITKTGSPLYYASNVGDLECVHALIEKGADVNARGGQYGSVLAAGALRRNLEIVRFLVENGADVNEIGGEYATALQAASVARNEETVRFLIKNGADVNAYGGQYGSALQAASYASYRDLGHVRFLIENGADVNAVGGTYGTALQAAACAGNLEIVNFLIEKGADVNTVGGEYGTALQAACHESSQHLEIMRLLIGNGADVNARGGEHGSPLEAGADCRGLEVVRLLVENGADVNEGGGCLGSALQTGAWHGDLEIVRFLVENGADVNACGGRYGSALKTSAYHGKLEIARFLVDKGADLNAIEGYYGSPLQAGACHGGRDILRFLVENGADVNAIGGNWGSALQAGAYHGVLRVVRFLVDNGADVNASGGKYGSALQAGAFSRVLSIVRYLVDKGADVNAGGGLYGSALQAGATSRSSKIVRFLVGKGADVNANGGVYGSALQAGAYYRRLKIVRFLIENGADIKTRGGRYGSALQASAFSGEPRIVRFLIDHGADVNGSEGLQGPATQGGAQTGNIEVVHHLVEDGAYVDTGRGKYGSALQAGARGGVLEIVRLLVEKGAYVNAGGGKYGSALQAGASSGNLEIVCFLVENGADVNAGGGKFGSALQAGASSGNLEIVRFLVENGADVNAGGGNFGSAFQAGASSRNLEIVRFLIENGADVNAEGGKFGSALQAGAYYGALDVVRFLVENGAYVNAIGGKYRTALDAALASDDDESSVEKDEDENSSEWDDDENSAEKDEIVHFLKSCGSRTWEEMIDLDKVMWKDMEVWA